jgi:hypothetical protein
MKLLDEKIGKYLWALGWTKRFGEKHKSTGEKAKNMKMGLYQIIKLLHSKGNINRMEKKLIVWDKIFANYTCDMG